MNRKVFTTYFLFLLLAGALLLNYVTYQRAEATVQVWNCDDMGLRANSVTVPVSIAAATSTTLVAASAGNQVMVIGYQLNSAAANTLQWRTNDTNITGAMPYNAGDTATMRLSDAPLVCTRGHALRLATGGAGAIEGYVIYVWR